MNRGRRPLVAGNWKMHHGGPTGVELASAVVALSRELPDVDLVIAPPFTAIAACAHECDGTGVAVAAQNLHAKSSGAFTGEVSGPMLRDAGCTWAILGHSERRHLFGETDSVVAEKVAGCLAAGLAPIACVGETLEEREAGRTLAVVERQVRAFLAALAASPQPVAIAYEPVWAIGTGRTAGPGDAQEVHAAIRAWLGQASGPLASRARILYGGSVKPDNAEGLLAAPDVDGSLVGGASLDAASFGAIARAAQRLAAP
ncbi:MAG TPA: triose-phosphate isomerase [Polyangiaceae bacterium]|nr:triose-phosphate isomerase [Polyangiaceae bacterium]